MLAGRDSNTIGKTIAKAAIPAARKYPCVRPTRPNMKTFAKYIQVGTFKGSREENVVRSRNAIARNRMTLTRLNNTSEATNQATKFMSGTP